MDASIHGKKNSALLERKAFTQRVTAALAAADLPVSATVLQRAFNAKSNQPTISIHAVRKWLNAEAIPTQARLRVLADLLGVSAIWLKFGDEVSESEGQMLSAQEQLLVKHFRHLSDSQRLHLLAMVQSIVDLVIKK